MTLKISHEALERQFLHDLHQKWLPHEGQVPIGRAIFRENKRRVAAQCGRGFGKSEFAMYIAWRKAALTPGLPAYLLAPWAKQAAEVYWASNRLQTFGPQWAIKRVYKQDKRLVFLNDSFIKLDGSDNSEIHRGPVMGFVVCDEFKDFHPAAWPAIRPNLLKFKEWAFYVSGTPPDNDATPQEQAYLNLMRECATSKDGYHTCAPSLSNPNLDTEEILNIKNVLCSTGREDEWLREYEGKFVKGGASSIFPNFDELLHVRPHDAVLDLVQTERSQLEFHCGIDPGSGGGGSRWAQIFLAYNPYKSRIYILDELYISDQKLTSVGPMYELERQKLQELHPYPDDWFLTYDEAAMWFYQERSASNLNQGLTPTSKAQMKAQLKELKAGISLLKDLFSTNSIVISDRCTNFVWEIKSYIKMMKQDGTYVIPDRNDDLLDAARYAIYRTGYTPIHKIQDPIKLTKTPEMIGIIRSPDCIEQPSIDHLMFTHNDDFDFWGF